MNKIILLLPIFFWAVKASFAQTGKLDRSFGDSGIAKTDLGSVYDYGYRGRIVLSQPDGSMYFIIERSGMTLIEKKLPDGTTDLAYGSKGYSLSLPGSLAALQPGGKVVVISNAIELARFNTDGSLDKTFGNDRITTGVARCIAIQNDGKIVVGGVFVDDDGVSEGALLYRFNKDGSLDTTTHFSPNGSELNSSVAIQADGKIIVIGTDNANGDGGNLLLRYNPDLSIDSTFSDDGLLQIDLDANSLKVQNDLRILVAGAVQSNTDSFVVSRYNIDGNLDNTFNLHGSVAVGFEISSIVIQGDGKIIAAGSITSGGNTNFAIARYKTNGDLDSTFDADGKKFTDFDLANDYANSIAIRSDGKIIALGSTTKGIATQIAAVRYNTNGSLDNSFDKDGKLTEKLKQGNTSYTSTAIQSDGKIIAAGNTWNGSAWDFALVLYKTDGSLDSTFSGDGKQTTHFGGTNDRASSVAIQTDGKIVVGGNSNDNFALSRYNTDGRPDSTFDGDGLKVVDFGSEDYINKIIILSTGKILVGGSRLVRFNNNGSLDSAFHSQIRESDDIAIQKDGRIIVAHALGHHCLFDRYNIDGSVDSTFGNNGTVSLTLQDEDDDPRFTGISMAIQNDGKLIFGVTFIINSRARVKFYNDYESIFFELTRINTDGTIDTSFRSELLYDYINTNSGYPSIKIQNDDKIILAGSSFNGSNYDFTILRYNTDGSRDKTFNGTGVQHTPLSLANDEIAGIDIVGNKLYAAGYGEFPGTFGVVARYLLSEYDVARVSLTSPANNAIYMAPVTGATVALKATVNDLNFTIKSVQFYIGSTLISIDSTNPYSYTINNLAPGNYSLVAVAIDNNGLSTASATVAISVLRDSVNKAPLVNISNPVTNSTFILPASLTINATASDPDGTIANVKFFNGSTLLATDSIVPYSYKINNPTAGTYKLYAQATDNKGLKNSSSTVSAFILPGASNKAPAVSITSPANNKNYPSIATLVLNASASDTDGNITNVKFYEGSVLLNTDSTSPYNCSISNPTTGKHSFVARAMDNKGLVSNSASVTVSIGPLANKSPDTKITTPLNNTNFIAGAAIMVEATAIDPDGTISKVEFFNGSTLLKTQYSGPFSYWMYDVVPGTYKLYARATDNKGLAGLSSSVSVFVVAGPSNKAPVIQLTSPANNSSRFTPGTILLSADASDEGSIANVNFYNGSTLITTDSIYPYDYTLTNLPVGNYSFVAKATDNKGLQSNSANAVVAVFKQPNKAPVVNLTSPVNNSIYIATASIILSAAASDEDGTITNVKFYDGATLLKTVSTNPYNLTMNNVPAGAHKFYAKATDNNGLSNTTSTDYVVVTAATNNTAPVTTINQSRAGKKLATAINKPGIMDLSTLRLIPNPAHNILNIYVAGLQKNSKETISIISSSGVVMKTIHTSSSGKAIRINVSSLGSGMYIIKMVSADKVIYRQLIKY